MEKKTISTILEKYQNKQKITALTCYDYAMAQLISSQSIDILLVGDSIGNVKLGYENTIPVTIEDMICHTKAVVKGNSCALVVADMPFMSYEISAEQAVENAGLIIKESGANAVKLEGGSEVAKQISAIVSAKIPVIGHLGLTPQSVHKLGGFKVQGKTEKEKQKIIEDAKELEKAGAFAIVLEAIPQMLAGEVTEILSIPTIGIGAGVYCDGQVLVIDDILGMVEDWNPKFVKKYANLSKIIKNAVKNYIDEVNNGEFPKEENTYK
jgi:3-methyl-2-oxobutanoate hydroxymethyltransferase